MVLLLQPVLLFFCVVDMNDKPIKDKYLNQAKMIRDCNFHLCGYGWFNITLEEFAHILQLADSKHKKELKVFYEQLSEYRLG